MNLSHTPLPWESECVSDHCRVFVGKGRKRIILARLAPKQLPELETAANGRLMAASPQLLGVAENAVHLLRELGFHNQNPSHPIWNDWDAIRMKLEGR